VPQLFRDFSPSDPAAARKKTRATSQKTPAGINGAGDGKLNAIPSGKHTKS